MKPPLSCPAKPNTDLRRVAILFSGGPAPSANAVIASAATCFSRAGIEVLGIQNGYTHLMEYDPGNPPEEGKAYQILRHHDLEGRRTTPGIMIGTARANPGKKLKSPADLDDPNATGPLSTVHNALCSLEVDALISIGGDDTLTTAAKFKVFQDRLPEDRKRIRVVHLPKTIDNDYAGIDFTFGFFTAVDLLAKQVRNLLADGESSHAWYVVQMMGRKAGWLSYGAAIAGEANLVIGLEDIADDWWTEEPTRDPSTGREILDDLGKPTLRKIIKIDALVDHLAKVIKIRLLAGKPYGVAVMAEGIGEFLPLDEIHKCISDDEYKALKPDSFGHFPVSQLMFTRRIGRAAADRVFAETGRRVKINGLQFGYEARCNPPTAFDVALGSQLGVGAYRALAEEGRNGVMISVSGQLELVYAPFEELIDYEILRAHARPIIPGEPFHQLARYLETRVED